MKKIYEIPSTQVVQINSTPILSDSATMSVYFGTQVDGGLSRRGHDLWEDEEEELEDF